MHIISTILIWVHLVIYDFHHGDILKLILNSPHFNNNVVSFVIFAQWSMKIMQQWRHMYSLRWNLMDTLRPANCDVMYRSVLLSKVKCDWAWENRAYVHKMHLFKSWRISHFLYMVSKICKFYMILYVSTKNFILIVYLIWKLLTYKIRQILCAHTYAWFSYARSQIILVWFCWDHNCKVYLIKVWGYTVYFKVTVYGIYCS